MLGFFSRNLQTKRLIIHVLIEFLIIFSRKVTLLFKVATRFDLSDVTAPAG